MLSLQKLDAEDIIKIEKMVKDQYKNFLEGKADRKDFADYFGPIYDEKPDQFTFTGGDVKMILQISEYVQLTVRKKGYGYFKGENSRCETNECDVSEAEMQKKTL